jgi:hypothetical protein
MRPWNADPGRQGLSCRGVELPDVVSQLQPRPDRALGVVLVRLGPTEIGEHAVAHVLGDVAAPALDHLGAGAMIRSDHLPHVFGVEPR